MQLRKKSKTKKRNKSKKQSAVVESLPAIEQAQEIKHSQVDSSPLLQQKLASIVFSFLDGKSAINLLATSNLFKNSCSDHLAHNIASLLPYYADEPNKNYQAVRDYYALQAIQEIKNPKTSYNKIAGITSTLTALKLLSNPQHNPVVTGELDTEWKAILKSKEPSEEEVKEKKLLVAKKLYNHGFTKSYVTPEKIHQFVLQDMAIVTSFNFSILDSPRPEFLNCFQVTKEVKNHPKNKRDTHDYYVARLATEIVNYISLPTKKLHAFVVKPHAHPIYAILQPYPIAAVSNYGENFAILDPALLNQCTANFGAGLDLLSSQSPAYHQSVTLNKSAYPLIAQLSQSALTALAYSAATKKKSDDFKTEYKSKDSQYIEIQLPNISLKQIKLFYFSPNHTIPDLKQIYELKEDIPVVIGNNPFKSPLFMQKFRTGKINEFLIKLTHDLIYQAALLIGETNESHLHFSLDEKALNVEFKITTNAPSFHQAQAVKILNLFGVRKYFHEHGVINFPYTSVHYYLPLDGSSKQEGKLTDHDAYFYHHRSLGQLLNVFLKHIFSVLIVCCQNDRHWKIHHKYHPYTFKGATEESNQARQLPLFEPLLNERFDIDVHWSFNTVLIRVLANEKSFDACVRWVIKSLNAINLEKYLIIRNNHIIINFPLEKILVHFKKYWHAYKTVVIFDDIDKTGNILLALRQSGEIIKGFQFPGGHNNDPLGIQDFAYDMEFGKIHNDPNAFLRHFIHFYTISNPKTDCSIFPLGGFKIIEEEKEEFTANSLQQFSLHSLGNLDEEQITTVAKYYNLDIDQYKSIFGNALPLTPYDSVIHYLEYCEKELSKFFVKVLLELSSDEPDVYVRINNKIKITKHKDNIYWLPTKEFGEIEISGGPKTKLKLLAETICSKLPPNLSKNVKFNMSNKFFTYKVTLININPHAILLLNPKSIWHYKPSPYIPPSFATLTELVKEKNFALAETIEPNEFIKLLNQLEQEDPKGQINLFTAFGHDQKRFNRLFFIKLKDVIHDPSLYELPKDDIYLLNAAFIFYISATYEDENIKLLEYIVSLQSPITDTAEQKSNEAELTNHIRKAAEFAPDKRTILHLAASAHEYASGKHGKTFPLKFLFAKYWPAINMKNASGETVLHFYACLFPIHSLTEYILTGTRELTRLGADVNAQDDKGNTPLHCAVKHKNFSLVKCLVEECKADCNIGNFQNQTPLELAGENSKIFAYLFSKTMTPEEKHQKMKQAERDHLNKLIMELSAKNNFVPSLTLDNLSTTDPQLKKILFAAVYDSNEEALMLITKLLNPILAVRDKKGNTLLHAACSLAEPPGLDSPIFFLLHYEADIYAINKQGVGVFYTAAANQNLLALTTLIDHAKDHKPPAKTTSEICIQLEREAKHSYDGMSLLHVSLVAFLSQNINDKDLKRLNFLLETYQAGINLKDNVGRNCLHIILNCFYHQKQGTAKASTNMLFKHKDPKADTTDLFCSALKLAINLGADVNAKMTDGSTPLHFAALMGNLKITQVLTEYGKASPNEKNKLGETPAQLASEKKNFAVARHLKEMAEKKEDSVLLSQIGLHF